MSNLPNGWAYAHLDVATDFIRGVSYKKDDVRDTPNENYVSILRANNIQDGKLTLSDLVYAPKENVKEHQLIKKGDIVISMSSGSKKLVGKSGLASEDQKAAFGTFCGVLRPNRLLNSKYVGLFTRSKEYLDKVSALSKGVNINNLKPSHFSEIDIPLPPLDEQIRIANKLDSLLTKVDAAQTRLKKIPTLLKRFRQSVLAAATSGELTKEWREGTDFKLEIKSLGDTGIIVKTGPFGSALHKHDYVAGGIPIINPMHINDGELTPSNSMTISMEKYQELSAWHLYEGDVIVGRRGEMGRAAVVIGENKKMLCGTGSMILRVNDKALPKYLELILRSPTSVEYFTAASVGSTMVNLNQGVIKNLQVHFPLLEEQKEIVRRVESLFALADSVEKQYIEAKKRTDRLTQSLLAKAFRGELVPQDPNDEPASELLKRIQAERVQMAASKAKPNKLKK